MWVRFLGREDSLEKEMATPSSILDWRIPWTEEPVGAVHRTAKSQTQLKRLSTDARTLEQGGGPLTSGSTQHSWVSALDTGRHSWLPNHLPTHPSNM